MVDSPSPPPPLFPHLPYQRITPRAAWETATFKPIEGHQQSLPSSKSRLMRAIILLQSFISAQPMLDCKMTRLSRPYLVHSPQDIRARLALTKIEAWRTHYLAPEPREPQAGYHRMMNSTNL